MHRPLSKSVAGLLSLALVGACPAAIDIPGDLGLCDPSPEVGDVPATPTYAGQVRAILEAHCAGCHRSNGRPPVLATYASAAAVSDQIVAAVLSESMPPLTPRGCCQGYRGERALTSTESAILKRWAETGAERGEASSTTGAVGDADGWLLASSSWAPQWAAATAQYTPAPRAGRDDVRCFLLEAPSTIDQVVTGFRVIHTSAQAARSAIYRVAGDEVDAFRALDAAADGPGWSCYAGVTTRATALLGAARADATERRLPDGLGRSLPAASQVLLLVQYATDGVEPEALEPDEARVELTLSDQTDGVAQTMLVANPFWLLTGGMTIGAGEEDVHHQFSFDPTAFETGGQPFEIFSVSLQMHDRGTRGQLVVERADGAIECLLAYDSWDTRAYTEHFLSAPLRVEPGERLAVSCYWDHSGGSQDLGWGRDGEVCLATVTYRVVVP